uniref:Cytochrome P450 CYP3-like member 2 n=1 Tax=Phallusia mammillata TaxID=59560 RepID=A0A6F9DAJ2_9ASCI|nr:cytochrome P450 CYP3-like member 2 [Phallusia mammillata]
MLSPLHLMAFETWILLATFLILAWFYVHHKWQFLNKFNIPHHPPSIRNLGTIGNMFDNPKQFFLKDLEMKRKFGTVYGTYTGWSPRIVISDPDILKQIMIKEFNIFHDRQKILMKIMGKVLNNGLTHISRDKWRRVRHTISPLFSNVKLRSMMRGLDACADAMVDNLRTSCNENDGVFDSKG